MNAKKIYLVSGNKGGVGKSFFSLCLIEYLKKKGESFSIIELDDGNPDVALTYETSDIDVQTVDTLLSEDPLTDIITALERTKTDFVIINAGAKDNCSLEGIKPFYDCIQEIASDFKVFWMVLSGEVGVTALQNFLKMTDLDLSKITVVMNFYVTKKIENFAFSTSKTRDEILAAGGSEITLPSMSIKLSDWLLNSHTPMSDAKITLINKLCIESHMKEMKKNLESIGV